MSSASYYNALSVILSVIIINNKDKHVYKNILQLLRCFVSGLDILVFNFDVID